METNLGKVYPATDRGLTETSALQCYSTFNFEKHQETHNSPFAELFLFNDNFIPGGKLTFYLAKADAIQLFLPIIGGLDIVAKGDEYAIKTGQIQVLLMEKGEVLEISNPYPTETINYLQIGIHTEAFFFKQKEPFYFNLEQHQNQLIEIIASYKLPFKLSAGLFTEHEATNYKLQNKQSKLFIFVVSGDFEIEGKTIHTRDGLALENIENAEIKAVSENALIIILELTP